VKTENKEKKKTFLRLFRL